MGGLMSYLSPALTVASEASAADTEGQKEGNALLRAIRGQELEQEAKRAQIQQTFAQTKKLLQPPTPPRDPVKDHAANRDYDNAHPIAAPTKDPATIPGTKEWKAAKIAEAQINRDYGYHPDAKGSIVQGPSGPVIVDPRTASSRPVTDASGQPLRAKPPAQIQQAVNANKLQLSKIDRAIQLLQDHPQAVGLRRSLPDALNQVIDKDGVDTRAAVSDIGSLLIHDRTGAAMSAAEAMRLKPFIPGPTDQSEAAIKKLLRLKQTLSEDTQFLAESFPGSGAEVVSPLHDDPILKKFDLTPKKP